MDQKYRLKAQINLSDFLFRDLTLTFLAPPRSTPRALTIEDNEITDFSRRQSITSISTISQQPIPTIKVTEDIKMTTEESTSTESGHREFTPLSNIEETIIREAKLDTLTLENNLSGIYNKPGPSSKKRKRDINIYKYNPSVSVA